MKHRAEKKKRNWRWEYRYWKTTWRSQLQRVREELLDAYAILKEH